MPKPKVAMGQTEIPVPPSPGAVAGFTAEDSERAYTEAMGLEAARRQRELWHKLNDCTCGRRKDHAVGCPKAKRYRP